MSQTAKSTMSLQTGWSWKLFGWAPKSGIFFVSCGYRRHFRLLTIRPAFEQINSLNLPNTFTDVIAKHLPAFVQKEGLAQMGIQLLQFFGTIWVKLGSQGLLMIRLSSHPTDFKSKKNVIVHRTPQEQDVILRYYPAIKVSQESIVSVTGAGDSLAGALVSITLDYGSPF